jgi:hypothetical protein
VTLLDYHRLFAEERKTWDPAGLERAARGEDPAFPEQVTELLPRPGERFLGDLIDLDTSALYQRIQRLCKRYRDGSDAQRVYIRSRMDHNAGSKLTSFGLRAAVVGARQRSSAQIQLALAAFAIADLTCGDVRDVLIPLAVVLHAAEKASGDAASEFHMGALLCGPAMAAVLIDYTSRLPAEHALGVMQWSAIDTPDGIGYRHRFHTAPKG